MDEKRHGVGRNSLGHCATQVFSFRDRERNWLDWMSQIHSHTYCIIRLLHNVLSSHCLECSCGSWCWRKGLVPAGCRMKGWFRQGAGGRVGSGRVPEEGLVPAGCRRKGWFRQGAGERVGSGRVPEEGLVPAGCRREGWFRQGAGGRVGSGRVPEEGLVPAGCRRKGAGGRVGSGNVPEEGLVPEGLVPAGRFQSGRSVPDMLFLRQKEHNKN